MPPGLRPLILSGGPAVGKSTCGRALAEDRVRGVFIDADDLRQLVVSGGEAPWKGPEGEAQAELAAVNASALAGNFLAAGFAVVIADFVTPSTFVFYRAHLPESLVVHLRISRAGARTRAMTRPRHITDEEFDLLHASIAAPPAADLVLDVDGLTVAEQISLIRTAWLGTVEG